MSKIYVDEIRHSGGAVAAMQFDSGGAIAEPNKEYFHVDLTTLVTGLSDVTAYVVDFGGNGTVKYDTKSNFDSANDAYLLDSSDGVYLINYSLAIVSDSLASSVLFDIAAAVEIATDGSTFTGYAGSGHRFRDSSGEPGASGTLSGSFLYKSTTATTKVRLSGFANASGTSTYEFGSNVNEAQGATWTNAANARVTFLSILRIA